ncbi:MAG: HlyD family efflux transporter periplasmic adaptor subunit [Deltaproteobacteria bacterium]|nr:HlyD family efflux transporter periplasmic adaptor subunit [Deltaproteobacteria bacterium]
MNHALRRKLWIAGIVLVVVLAVLYGFLPRTQEVDFVKVSRGPLQVTIEEEGRTRLKDRFTVSAPTAGYMRRVEAKVGDRVKRGQTLVVLEPLRSQPLDLRSRAEAEAVVSAAEASLAAALEKERAAAADADYVEKRRGRIAGLYAKGSVARDQLDQIDSEAGKTRATQRSAKAAADAARSELERARTTLRNFAPARGSGKNPVVELTAPVNGSILRLYRESEGAVQTGEPLMDIGNAGALEVRVEVLSSDAVRIRPGMKVLFKRWGRDEPLEGRVRRVEPAGFTKVSSLGVEEQRVLVIADITSPPEIWRALGDAYRLEAHFVIWEGKDILQVPASALFRSGTGWAVFAEEEGRARLRPVVVGQKTGLTVELVSGLKENDRVVAYPDDAISDGTRIRPRK